MRRVARCALLLGVVTAGPAAAQEEITLGPQQMIPGPWKFDNFPYFTITPNHGFMFIGRAQYGQAADFLDRVSMARRFALEAGASPAGSRFAALMVDMPRVAPGWRVAMGARVQRDARFGSIAAAGVAKGGRLAFSLDDPDRGDRVLRRQALARVEVSRTVVGPLAVAASGSLTRTDWSRLPPNGLQEPRVALRENDGVLRLALLLDTRDREFEPQRGVLLEGGWYAGTYGEGYHGGYGLASAFVNPRFGTVVAARVGGRSVSAESPLQARYTIPAWERPLTVLGGPDTHRALDIGRRAGQGVLFGSLEIRQVVLDGGDMVGLYGLAFLDAGRAFEGIKFRLTTEDLQVGGGVGLALRILRANIFNATVATGPDGVKVMVGSGWMF